MSLGRVDTSAVLEGIMGETTGMGMLKAALSAAGQGRHRTDPRACEVEGQLHAAREAVLSGDVEGAQRLVAAALGTLRDLAKQPAREVPFGYETVYGFLSRYAPAVLSGAGSVEDAAAACDETSAEVEALCRARGLRPVLAHMPEGLRAEGGDAGGEAVCLAFPIAVLRDHFDVAAGVRLV